MPEPGDSRIAADTGTVLAIARAEAAYQASTVGRITALFNETPPEDPPYNPGAGRGEAYERGRTETWRYFASEVRDKVLAIVAEIQKERP